MGIGRDLRRANGLDMVQKPRFVTTWSLLRSVLVHQSSIWLALRMDISGKREYEVDDVYWLSRMSFQRPERTTVG